MNLAMPTMLGWVLGGNIQNLKQEDRLPYCNLKEQPKGFDQRVRPASLCCPWCTRCGTHSLEGHASLLVAQHLRCARTGSAVLAWPDSSPPLQLQCL